MYPEANGAGGESNPRPRSTDNEKSADCQPRAAPGAAQYAGSANLDALVEILKLLPDAQREQILSQLEDATDT